MANGLRNLGVRPGDTVAILCGNGTFSAETILGAITAGAPLTAMPAGAGGFVAPKPVPQSTTVSPGLAGEVPGIADGSDSSA